MNKYEFIRVIGDGTYGIVYEGKNKQTKEQVAIKKLKEKYQTLEECKNTTEIKILEKLYHENIIHLKEVIRDFNGEIFFIFEYCDCNLLEFIDIHKEKNKKIPEPIIRDIILQLTKGLRYLHSNHYFHRDLKPENILLILNKYDLNNLSNNNINDSCIKVKIADFGTAKKIPNKDTLTITEYVCTRWYRSPECILRTDYYNETSDIWALGCIMAELYKLEPLFPGENEFDQINQIFKILGTPTKGKWSWGYSQAEYLGIQFPVYYKKDLKTILGYIGNDGVNLLNQIFQFEYTKRPSCNKILNHSFFKLIPRAIINNASYGIRNSFPHIIKKENYNRLEHKSQNKMKYLSNNTGNNYICHSFYNGKKINAKKKYSDTNVLNQNLTGKNSNKNIINYNNSSSTNIKDTKEKNNISSCIKIISNSYRKNKINNNIKYITINESKNGITSKKIFPSIRKKEESKVNENNSSKKEFSTIILSNNGRKKGKYFSINNNSKRELYLNNSFEEKKDFNNNISLLKINNNNYLTLNEKNNSEKFNKIIVNKFTDRKLINNIQSQNINKYQIYPNCINNTSSRISKNESINYMKNKEQKGKKSPTTKNNFVNISNKRNKFRKNYKFSEIHVKKQTKYNENESLQNNQLDKTAKKCICSLGNNPKDFQRLFQNKTNNILKISISKNISNYNLNNSPYIKNINNMNNKKIQLSPLKKNNILLFEKSASINKKIEKKDINQNELINKRTNRKGIINIALEEEESNLNSNINSNKKK